ncbi:MAG: Ig-like domain-containing protein [Lachnospiraceae bacterium]|nr:Ig-like domain-containing protein [Lachnospiraceae bacterium]
MKKRLFCVLILLLMTLTLGCADSVAEAAGSIDLIIGGERVNGSTYTVKVGETVDLSVNTNKLKDVKKITYRSAKKSVVSVSKKGRIKAKKPGTAKIRVTVRYGSKTKKAWVRIKAEEKQGNMIDTNTAILNVIVGDRFFSVDLESNSSAEAFFEKLRGDDLEIDMKDYGGFEKVGTLPWSLPTNDTKITTKPGDLILYQGNKLTIYYDENTWDFTKIGHLNGEPEEIAEVFGGKEDIKAEFFLEWTE